MRILALSDSEVSWLSNWYDRRRLDSYDLIVSCGDLSPRYLSRIATLARAPLLYVRGNHDARYDAEPPEGCWPIEDQVVSYRGLQIAGLGGSLPYNDSVWGFSEKQMARKAKKLARRAERAGGLDLLVTHAPVRDYGDLDDLPHQGFEALGGFLDRVRPQVMVHGHVHMEYGRVARELAHPSGTRLLNACGFQEFELEPGERGKVWRKPARIG